MFGGNSNKRGPIWFPMNYILIEALARYHLFCGDDFRGEFPTGSGDLFNLRGASQRVSERLVPLFQHSQARSRPTHGESELHEEGGTSEDLIQKTDFG